MTPRIRENQQIETIETLVAPDNFLHPFVLKARLPDALFAVMLRNLPDTIKERSPTVYTCWSQGRPGFEKLMPHSAHELKSLKLDTTATDTKSAQFSNEENRQIMKINVTTYSKVKCAHLLSCARNQRIRSCNLVLTASNNICIHPWNTSA